MIDSKTIVTDKSIDRPPSDSVERAVDQIGDRWIFLILREAFFGVRRFDGFLKATGAAPNILTDRLRSLVASEIFEKVQYSKHANRFEYRLTQKGRDLYPAIVLLMRWGDRWCSDGNPAPLRLIHDVCGHDFDSELTCQSCGEEISARDMSWKPTSSK